MWMAVCGGELSYKIVCGMNIVESKLSPITVCTLIVQPDAAAALFASSPLLRRHWVGGFAVVNIA